jgi:hypothetical protein
MFEYKFVPLKTSVWTSKPKEDYKQIIEEYARQGWRFIQMIVTPNGAGSNNFEMVFERVV